MKDLSTLTFHPTIEKLTDLLCLKTQNDNPQFFRVLLNYHVAKMSAIMGVKLVTKDRGIIPVNLYAINLAPSGNDKGYSTNIIEEYLTCIFKQSFMEETLPTVSESALASLALRRSVIQDVDENSMLETVRREYDLLGKFAFAFDSGTPAAIKQMRHKLLMSGIGSVNLEIDEIGSNLIGNGEALNTFLELFDVGKVKQKLVKNTRDNVRNEEIEGKTPACLLLFGTPIKLFDGGKVENEFYSFLETGYARRCIFGFTQQTKAGKKLTPEEVYDILVDPDMETFINDTALRFGELANVINHNKQIIVPKKVSLLSIAYRLHCEDLAFQMGEHQEIAKAEMAHRYFKALKLAGAYAFIDKEPEVTEENLYHAICLVEESGKAFEKILSRDRTYVKLAKYLGTVGREVTHVDLTEDLPFYRGSIANKQELVQLAAAWGYKNHIIIKRSMTGGIEFLSGEALKKTDLQGLHLAHSSDIANGYTNVRVSWDNLYKLTQEPGQHWINHHSATGNRSENNMLPGFDLVVLDVDSGTKVKEVMKLLSDYRYLIHTTKRHTNSNHRFRIILPTNYQLKLSEPEYRKFMANIYEWLPFEVDTQTSQRARKWLTHPGQYCYNNTDRHLDVRLFIPKTTKNDERSAFVNTFQSMTNLERWFLNGNLNGNRNNQLAKYAFLLADLGYSATDIRERIIDMNNKLPDKLTHKEIDNTIMSSVRKKVK